ncbi:hypothetical protein LTR78_010417 [Recurvomyces mirabilis]|uniref:AB hydrolase-1 domain-containing protein n=1 Tax=Recurvomyces mirabilis TaxID=574656 RepID=A0AAE0TMV1_9PEZI|nr:hypothetical protein LTR78_010417 [Recurvomyces mirabilis]KAK5150495.1 hypothetical protein LTS14_009988 [Recurvomyces mirabilis]
MSTTKQIKTSGGTLSLEITGSGPLVICCHGMGDTRDAFVPFAQQFSSNGYTVANMDARGHGESSTTFTSYGDLATAADYLTITHELNLGPAILAGNSFAGASAIIAAGQAPELIAGIILLAPFARNPMGALGTYLVPAMFTQPWGPTVWRYYAPTLWPGLDKKAATDRAIKTKTSLTRPGRWSAFHKTVRGLDHSVATPWLAKVKAPVLMVMGDKDPDYSDPKKEAEWILSQFSQGGELMVLEGVGHGPMFERPEEVGSRALEFVSKVEKREGKFVVRG